MTTEPEIRSLLDGIVDPCSVNTGVPAGIDAMGLVRDVKIRDGEGGSGADVHVTLGLTEPGCLMGAMFKREAETRLNSLPGVATVTVELDLAADWDRNRLAPDYRELLARARAASSRPSNRNPAGQ